MVKRLISSSKEFIDAHKPDSILLPAQGQGRSAIYARKKNGRCMHLIIVR